MLKANIPFEEFQKSFPGLLVMKYKSSETIQEIFEVDVLKLNMFVYDCVLLNFGYSGISDNVEKHYTNTINNFFSVYEYLKILSGMEVRDFAIFLKSI
jgi:hypothetical protein